jgi:multidrug efflux pump subunit AcrA (membrane-fusion protein)
MSKKNILILFIIASCMGCHSKTSSSIPDINDDPVVVPLSRVDLPEEIPSYGIVLGGGKNALFEVNVEAEDSSLIKIGQKATASVVPSNKPIPCVVSNVVREVSTETGQAIAWLKAEIPTSVERGEFIYASISVAVKHGVLAVPKSAVLTREGHTWVIRQEKNADQKIKYNPVQVEVGATSENLIEITSGLKEQDQVVSEGNIGFLYPDFKASQGDD